MHLDILLATTNIYSHQYNFSLNILLMVTNIPKTYHKYELSWCWWGCKNVMVQLSVCYQDYSTMTIVQNLWATSNLQKYDLHKNREQCIKLSYLEGHGRLEKCLDVWKIIYISLQIKVKARNKILLTSIHCCSSIW